MELKNELVQAIANYLATKPYQEVAGLIGELQRSAQIKPEVKKDEKKDEK
jgi:hypothetical protein